MLELGLNRHVTVTKIEHDSGGDLKIRETADNNSILGFPLWSSTDFQSKILESLINITLATKVKAIIASVGIRGIRKVT